MNISKQYAWQSAENYHENNPLLPQSLRGLVIGKSGCGKTISYFNLVGSTIITCMYLEKVFAKVLRKGLEAGLSKQQISNVFNSQEALGDIPSLIAIEK